MTIMVVICCISIVTIMLYSPNHSKCLNTDVRYRKELFDSINKNNGSKVSYILLSMFRYTIEQDKLDIEYM